MIELCEMDASMILRASFIVGGLLGSVVGTLFLPDEAHAIENYSGNVIGQCTVQDFNIYNVTASIGSGSPNWFVAGLQYTFTPSPTPAPTSYDDPNGKVRYFAVAPGTYTVKATNPEIQGTYTVIAPDCASLRRTLKVCKVAGPGVSPGSAFTFQAGSASPFTVRAGAGPGGACRIGPGFAEGATVTVTESLSGGTTVTGIAVAPPARLVGTPDLTGGSVQVQIGTGVTEVTFTNRRPTGFLEICKTHTPQHLTRTYSFTVNPGNLGPFEVISGTCSPAIEVRAGVVTIKEAASPNSSLVSCSTIPAANQGACNIAARTSTVTVAQGDVSTQTIAFIKNKIRIGVGPRTGAGTDGAIREKNRQ